MSKTKVWKLQIKKVTEVKEGQIWQKINEDKSLFVVKNNFTEKYEDGTYVVGAEVTMYTNVLEYGGEGFCPEQFLQNECKLIGALGIDYEIVGGKLVKKEVKHPAVGCVYNHSESYANYMVIYRNLENQTIKVAYENGLVEGAWISSREEDKPIGSPAVYELKFVEE